MCDLAVPSAISKAMHMHVNIFYGLDSLCNKIRVPVQGPSTILNKDFEFKYFAVAHLNSTSKQIAHREIARENGT